MANDSESKQNLMSKPLPQILNEIEDSIRLADEAAKNARDAALKARETGEKAASEATKITNERIDRVEQTAKNAMQLTEQLKSAIMDGMAAVEKRLSEKALEKESAAKSE